MNAIQDLSKKTSITSLLNPQDVSAFSNVSSMTPGPILAHPQANASYYPPQFSTPSVNYSLRAANWDHSDESARRKVVADTQPRYPIQLHEPPHLSQPQTSNYMYAPPPRMIRPHSPVYHSQGHTWHHQPNPQPSTSSNLLYAPPTMYSDERTAVSGEFSSNAISYPPNYGNQTGSSMENPQTWQTTERASVRLAARESSAQPTTTVTDDHYHSAAYYQPARMYDPPAEQQQHQQQHRYQTNAAVPSSSQYVEVAGPSNTTSSKRPNPDSDDMAGPKPKRAKGKGKGTGAESTTATPAVGSSKRGYNAKKRSEAAFISAQNEALVRVQRDATFRQTDVDLAAQNYNSGVTNDQFYVPELQFARCMSNRYKKEEFPRCVSCTRRWAGDTCRFQGIRYFMRDAQKKLLGVSFNEHQPPGHESVMKFPTQRNRALTHEHIKCTKLAIAKALSPVLKYEQSHVEAQDIVRRPRECDVRVTCDTCMTSLFSASFMCRMCGREVCNDCFNLVRALTKEPSSTSAPELVAWKEYRDKHAHSNPFFLNCLKRNEHAFKDFTPVTRFTAEELNNAVAEMDEILYRPSIRDDDASSNEANPENFPSVSPHRSLLIQTPSPSPLSPPLYDDYTPSNTPESVTTIPIHRLQIISPSLYDDPKSRPPGQPCPPPFSDLWKASKPILVKDILPRFKVQWTPEYFMDRYGDHTCLIVDSQVDENKKITVRDFFSMFGKYGNRKNCWKLKDWPPTAEFKTAFPELFEDFSQAVPVPDYVRRDGVSNIASHFPTNAIGPDLGPKMYNALASSQDVGSKGSTRLHMDMADAFNVMLHATPCEDGTEGYAAWDLFRAEDSHKIRAFLKSRYGYNGTLVKGTGSNGSSSSTSSGTKKSATSSTSGSSGSGAGEKAAPHPMQMVGPDPIHGQQFYLDVQLRRELYEEYQVKSYRVYQRPGDGIFIPAGCAHQVANMADCIKIAIDFVSPENIARCETLTKEFREQNQSKVWKEDVLQLRTMMWFAWQSCNRWEKERQQEVLQGSSSNHQDNSLGLSV